MASTRPPATQTQPAARSSANILVSPRQKGNPILSQLRAVGWEFTTPSTPADYIVGSQTCVLFLSLRYHKLHPEYIHGRIRAISPTSFRLRIVLVLVDVDSPDDPVRSLNSTCVLSNLTLVLAWSAAEAARYLELYKSFEHSRPLGVVPRQYTSAASASISSSTAASASATSNLVTSTGPSGPYGAHVVDFATAPRSVNKTDAIGIVAAFGSVRAAVNAKPDDLAQLAGWGHTKVNRWTCAVSEPFRRGNQLAVVLAPNDDQDDQGDRDDPDGQRDDQDGQDEAQDTPLDPKDPPGPDAKSHTNTQTTSSSSKKRPPPPSSSPADAAQNKTDNQPPPGRQHDSLDPGIEAALARLRSGNAP